MPRSGAPLLPHCCLGHTWRLCRPEGASSRGTGQEPLTPSQLCTAHTTSHSHRAACASCVPPRAPLTLGPLSKSTVSLTPRSEHPHGAAWRAHWPSARNAGRQGGSPTRALKLPDANQGKLKAAPAEETLRSGWRTGHQTGEEPLERWGRGRPPAHRGPRDAACGQRGRYLVLLLVVQPLSVGVRLSNQRVHQHQEGHVEQEGAHHRQVDDDDDLRAEGTQLALRDAAPLPCSLSSPGSVAPSAACRQARRPRARRTTHPTFADRALGGRDPTRATSSLAAQR